MAMSAGAMLPQGITIEAVNGMLAERLAQQHGEAFLLRALIPLPPHSSAQDDFLNCMFSKATSFTATMMMAAIGRRRQDYRARWSNYGVTPVLLAVSGMAELGFIRTHGSRFTPQDCTLFNWLAR
ncbi:hypothetical protein ACNKHW_15785 [Shigella flexneri]